MAPQVVGWTAIAALLWTTLTVHGKSYEWSCSPLNVGNEQYYLPNLPVVGDEAVFNAKDTVGISNPALVYTFPVPSSLNCSGTVSAVRYCYTSQTSQSGSRQLVFTLLTFQQSGLSLTITKAIPVYSTPKQQSASRTLFGSTQFACDTFVLNETEQFPLPTETFAFGMITLGSTVDLLAYEGVNYPELLVEHYRPVITNFPEPVVGNTHTIAGSSDLYSDRALRMFQFIIDRGDETKATTQNTGGAQASHNTTIVVGVTLGVALILALVMLVAIIILLICTRKSKGVYSTQSRLPPTSNEYSLDDKFEDQKAMEAF